MAKTITGLLHKDKFSSLSGWTNGGSWASAALPSYVCFDPSPFEFTFTPASDDAGGVREGNLVIDNDGTWWMFYGAGNGIVSDPGEAWRVQVASSTDMGITWTKHGPTDFGIQKTDDPLDGDWAARDQLYVEKRGSTWYMYPLYAENALGGRIPAAPYGSDLFTASSPLGPWTYIRTQLVKGSSGQFDDLAAYTGCVVLDGGVYHNFYSAANAGGQWAIGLATSSDILDAYTKQGTVIPLTTEGIENPKVWYSAILGKWIMTYNHFPPTTDPTDYNYLLVSDDLTDWSSAVRYEMQRVSLMQAETAVGIPSPIYTVEGVPFEDSDGNISITYDTYGDGTQKHEHRSLRIATLEVSPTCARYNNTDSTERKLSRSIGHTSFVAEFVVEMEAKAGSGTRGLYFYFRSNGTTGYRVFMSADGGLSLEKNTGAGWNSVDAGSGNYDFPVSASPDIIQRRVKVKVQGDSIRLYLDGELQVQAGDTSFSTGTQIAFGGLAVTACIRNFSMYLSSTIVKSSLEDGQEVAFYNHKSPMVFETAVDTNIFADCPHYPATRTFVDGNASIEETHGGDRYGTYLQEPDTEPPTVPTNLQLTVISDTQIDGQFDASTDNRGVIHYRLKRATDSGFTANVVNTDLGLNLTFSATGLTADTEYFFKVLAEDAAENQSAYSATESATTDPEPSLACTYIRYFPRAGLASRMDNCKVYGSNTSPTADLVELATTSGSTSGWNVFPFSNTTEYQFLLVWSNDASKPECAELEFYTADDLKLTAIDTYGSANYTSGNFVNAFDGSTGTECSTDGTTPAYLGIEIDLT